MGNAESAEKVQQVVDSARPIFISQKGDIDSFDFRVHALDKVTNDMKPLSMWHDIKLYPTPESKSHNVVNMVNEVSLQKLTIE